MKDEKIKKEALYQEKLNKMKEEESPSFWKLLKTAWSNKRYRGLIVLFFWFAFLFFIAGGLRTTYQTKPLDPPKTTVLKNALETFGAITNYEFQTILTYQVTNDTLKTRVLKGSRVNFKERFSNESDKILYYMDNGVMYKKGELKYDPTDDEFIEITLKPDVLEKLLKVATLESTTNYKDGSIKKDYSISMKKFMSVYKNVSTKSMENILISTLEINHTIYEVDYDLLNYMNQSGPQYEKYQLQIKYENIGAVKSIEIE